MEFAVAALAIVGIAVGMAFRFKVLLPIISVLLVASVVFSLSQGFGFLDTALMVFIAQIILQGSYFLGLLIRAILRLVQRMRSTL